MPRLADEPAAVRQTAVRADLTVRSPARLVNVAVIGAGLAGLATADGLARAGVSARVYEAAPSWGGHTRSETVRGFVFDEGPHVSFTQDERVRAVFARGAGEVPEAGARILNWFEGRWVPHPAQVHLHGLDPDLVTRCITDMVTARSDPPAIANYADWLVAQFGRTFAETFPYRYTRKYWTVEPDQLGTDWVGSRVYPPSLEEVVRGALAPAPAGRFHYLSRFRYPRRGGYQSFLGELVRGADIRAGHEVTAVDVGRRELHIGDGTVHPYDRLVSTMPLDRLLPRLRGVRVPDDVRDAAAALLCTSVVLVDIALPRADLLDADWFYVYDEDICAARVHLPHRLSPGNAPPGSGSIQAEVYFSRTRPLPLPADQLAARVVADLVRMGLVRDEDEPLFARHRVLEHANVVFDHRRRPALDVIEPFLDRCGILRAGRYGEWAYHWTDDATNAGWRAAATLAGLPVDELLERVKPD